MSQSLQCPVCGLPHVHIEKTNELDPRSRGCSASVVVFGECGHRWRYLFTQNTSQLLMAVEPLPDCDDALSGVADPTTPRAAGTHLKK